MNEFEVISFNLPLISNISNKVWSNPSDLVLRVYKEIAETIKFGMNDLIWKELGYYIRFYYDE